MSLNKKAIFEWAGCGFGLLGSLLLSLNNSASRYGFIAFLCSNLCWLLFAKQIRSHGLLLMQLGFMATSVFGIYRWMV